MAAVHEDLNINESFPRRYEVEWLMDMPSSPTAKVYFLSPTPHAQGSGPILRITTEHGSFVAVVGGEASELRLETWPNPDAFLALPSAVLVNTVEPGASYTLKGFNGHSVHYVLPVADKGVILIGHCCAIYCYNTDGLLWKIEDAFCCEDPVVEVAGDNLILIANQHGIDPPDTPTKKTFGLLTGRKIEAA